MGTKRSILIAAVAFASAMSLFAAPMTVSWSDGKVDLKQGSSWDALAVGDKVDSASTVRLGKGSALELTDGKRKVSLSSEGTYVIDSLLKKGAAASKQSAVAMDKLGKLVDPQASVGTATVAAVRGAAVEPAKDSVDWQSDSADFAGTMEEGRRLVRAGDFAGGALRFREAAGAAEGADKDAALYAEAWSLSADGSQARATSVLRSMPGTGNWAGPRALLLARLDIDSGSKDEAASVIQAGLDSKVFVADEVELARSLLDEASAR